MLYDLIVLGGGPAGYRGAECAGKAGLSVLIIEERSLGGVCLNEGCIPTKTLLYSAKLYDGAARGEKYGVTAEGLALAHAKVVARKDKVVKTLVAGVRAAMKAAGVTVVAGRGIIRAKTEFGYTVEANGETYEGKRLLIATGSSSAVPPIPGLREALESGFALTNREALALEDVPKKLTVIGGGVIGLELASYFNTAGSEVTIVEMLGHIAGENDADLVKILQKNYEKRGVTFLLAAKVTRITENAVHYEKDGVAAQLPADRVLLSIGRRPNSADIGLDAIGVMTERGAVVTDAQMKTNRPEVYAAGDVNGKSMLAHTAYREAEVAVNNMLGQKDTMRYEAIPAVLYTNPELASVGLTEAHAKEKGVAVQVVTLPMRFSGRYLAENEGGDGQMKLIVDAQTRAVLGVQALSNYASEFIAACAAFVELSLTVEEVKRIVFPHPTVAEIVREAAFHMQ